MSTATLNGLRCTSARVSLPAWGLPYAEASVDQPAALVGSAELKIADFTFIGTILNGGEGPKGRSSFRLVGGAGGWGRTIPAKGYTNDAGVKLSTVVVDAAGACGETLDASTLPATKLGSAFVRELAPAARVLQHVAPEGWYVGEDGITRIGRRPAAPLAVAAQRGPLDAAQRSIEIAATSIASIVPGVVVDGLEAVDVEHRVSRETGLRSRIWAGETGIADRFLAQLKRLILQIFPWLRYAGGPYEYRVVTLEGERLNLQPVRVSIGFPDLRRVVARPGVAGCKATVPLGSRVLVSFVNNEPARPVVVGYEDAESEGFAPTRLDLVGVDDTLLAGGDAAGRGLRYGDTVMMPSGPSATPAPVVLVPNPLASSSVSRVRL